MISIRPKYFLIGQAPCRLELFLPKGMTGFERDYVIKEKLWPNHFPKVTILKATMADTTTDQAQPTITNKEEIQTFIDNQESGGYTLLDVRTPQEANSKEKPMLPTAHNVPITELNEALEMSNEDFKKKYGFDKPEPNTVVITYCQAGGRASRAANALVQKQDDHVLRWQRK